LHKNGGIESLNEDEVQIIGAVLDLREKYVSVIMTPLEDVYTLRADEVLNQELVDEVGKIYIYIFIYFLYFNITFVRFWYNCILYL
jgi:Mg2+/Co2+ transporter CorB